jgi:hypothetical protein
MISGQRDATLNLELQGIEKAVYLVTLAGRL